MAYCCEGKCFGCCCMRLNDIRYLLGLVVVLNCFLFDGLIL